MKLKCCCVHRSRDNLVLPEFYDIDTVMVYMSVLLTVLSSVSDINCLPDWGLCGGRALGGSHGYICSLNLSCVMHSRLRQELL